MGVTVLIYAVWSGHAASATNLFFLSFPTICGSHRELAKHSWLKWVTWPSMVFLFCVTMLDLVLSRSGDPWFSSTLHRTITGLLGSFALACGYMMRRANCKTQFGSSVSAATRFWPS